ncbi:MAG: ribosome assembly RNA-binding protein YhbY [Desulfuromonadales bacterium]|nr:ribosome assembly RNA-binding protein YhbY [Desulfuromonadales bacterium]
MQPSPTPTLTGKQARFLRGLGHALRPAVMIGRQELTDAVRISLDESLTAHELVKVKLQEGCLLDRREAAEKLAAATGAAVAQVLGKTILLYRPSDKKLISLP